MQNLTNRDLHFVMSRTPKDVRKLMQESGVWLGGGFIRATIGGEKPSDIDLFGTNTEGLETIAYKFANERRGRHHKTKNAVTVLSPPRLPVQFITRWVFQKPDEVIESFDFTVCQAVIHYNGEEFHSFINDEFYSDLAAKRLVYTKPNRNEDAGGSMLRILKYLKRGYNIQAPSLGKVIARIVSAINFNEIDPKDEAHVGKIVVAVLREVDPLYVIDGVDFVDEHQIEGTKNES